MGWGRPKDCVIEGGIKETESESDTRNKNIVCLTRAEFRQRVLWYHPIFLEGVYGDLLTVLLLLL